MSWLSSFPFPPLFSLSLIPVYLLLLCSFILMSSSISEIWLHTDLVPHQQYRNPINFSLKLSTQAQVNLTMKLLFSLISFLLFLVIWFAASCTCRCFLCHVVQHKENLNEQHLDLLFSPFLPLTSSLGKARSH